MKKVKTSRTSIAKFTQLSIIALFIAIVGCKKDSATAANKSTETAAPTAVTTPAVAAPPIAAMPDLSVGKPGDVLAEVNGSKLTRAEVEEEINTQMEALKDRIPPDRKEEFRQGMYKYTVEQFVVRELLLGEAKKQKIEVTQADKEKAYEQIKENLPPGKTIEEAMEESPLGKERMEKEINTGLTITKLIEQEMANKVSVTDADVAKFKEENLENLKTPESVTASHILIGFEDGDSDEVKAEKKAKAEKIQAELVAGGDFAKLAMENSSCPSKEKGGDLGKFGRGQMVPAFETAAFAQKIGEIGPVVETKFGYHIIKVTAREKDGIMPDNQIKKIIESQKQRKVASDLIDSLRAKAKITYAAGFEPPPAPAM